MTNRISFTSYIVEIIKNTAINYKKKKKYISNKEIQFLEQSETDVKIISQEQLMNDENLENVNYLKLENVFTKKEYYNAMKNLEDREKLVLYLSIVKHIPLKKTAILLKTTANNVSKIKYRAKKKFLKNLDNGR